MSERDQLSPAGFAGGQGRTAEDVADIAEGGAWLVGLACAGLAAGGLIWVVVRLVGRLW